MTADRDDETLAHLVDALGPYVDRVVIVGGWAHRLFRHHPLAQPLSYPALMTRDMDIALAPGIRPGERSLRDRLLAHGFREEFLGDDRPPVTHYHLGGDDAGFYVEFLTPLVGGEFTRGGNRDVTTPIFSPAWLAVAFNSSSASATKFFKSPTILSLLLASPSIEMRICCSWVGTPLNIFGMSLKVTSIPWSL
jgi:hypothetical protein